jgi:hypothetical protein
VIRVSGGGGARSAVDPGATCTAGALTAMSAGALGALAAATTLAAAFGTGSGPGGGSTGRGSEMTARARTAILRVTDAFSRRLPLNSSARTDIVVAAALAGAVKRILNLPRVSPERLSPTHVPALRRCSTTRARCGARLAVPLAVMLAPLATDAGTDRESEGGAAACAAHGQPAAVTTSAASATETTRISTSGPCPWPDCSFGGPSRQAPPPGC